MSNVPRNLPVGDRARRGPAPRPFRSLGRRDPFLFALPLFLLLLLPVLRPLPLGAALRPAWTSNRVIGSPNPPALFAVERLLGSRSFDHPVDFLVHPDGRLLLVAEQGGKLWSVDTQSGEGSPQLVADFRRLHAPGPFDGVLGFTLHPGVATNHFLFVNYNEPGSTTNGAYLSRFTLASLNPPTVDPASEKVIVRWLSGGHNGCSLAFGNDGFLYFSTGDAANPDPPDSPYRTGQDISDLLASVQRIDVDHPSGASAYSIPSDNPFLHTAGARPEVWAFGFRNPFRLSFDSVTGDLWVGDVGWEQWEMIHRVQRGGNYGWSIAEGPNRQVRTDVPQGPGPILPPVIALPHSEAASITGGRVYHGDRLSRLRGAYVYGDWETGKFWALRHKEGVLMSNEELCDTTLKPVAFAADARGEILVLDYSGGVYRFVPNQAPPANQSFPRRLSETGLFSSLTPFQPAPGTVAYTPAAPAWNDHATAEWLLGVPGQEAIVTQGGVGNIAGATWFFPSNTTLARTLTLEMETGVTASRRRIETQLLHWDGQSWNPYAYRWNPEQTEAVLVGGDGTNAVLVVKDAAAPGGERVTPWRFAARAECLRCHNAWAGDALTLNWLQLARPASGVAGGPGEGTELDRLRSLGVLEVRDRPSSRGPVLANPQEASAPAEARARSWLHVNCSTCHRFGAGGTAAIHLNLEKADGEMRAWGEKPLRGDFGLASPRILAAGDPYRSVLFYRLSTEGAGHMPQIGPRLIDPDGVAAVRSWILGQPFPSGTNEAGAISAGREIASARSAFLAPSGSPEKLAAAAARLLGSPNGALALSDACLEQPSTRRIGAAQEAAGSHPNAMVRDLLQRWLPPAQRRRTLGADFSPSAILNLTGVAERGRELFHGVAQCAQCHVCEGRGRLVGPDLSGIRRKYQGRLLLDQLLAPSAVIAPEYQMHQITLLDETELRGFILRREAGALLVREESGTERTVRLADVKEDRESTVSAMPEGLLAPLTAQEAADLLAYLSSTPVP